MDPGLWNSLEVAKLASGLLTPAVIALGGIYVHRITKRFEHIQWQNQKLIEKRLTVYDDITPELNDLLCYFTYIGSWRDFDPPQVIFLKRAIDKKIYLAAPLFSKEFFEACMAFQECCFQTYTGWGQDPKLRTQFARREQALAEHWKTEWSLCFSNEPSDPEKVRAAYRRVMESFAANIGVDTPFVIPPTGPLPANIE